MTQPIPLLVLLGATLHAATGCTGSSPATQAAHAQPAEPAAQDPSVAEDQDAVVSPDVLAERAAAELGPNAKIDVVETWFVVASTAPDTLHRRGLGTIRRVYTALYLEYLQTPPAAPVSVYLFGDDESYRHYVRTTYGSEPDTPYGFYMGDERKMVMNLATGTGTLAHELVHPLLAQDFAQVPAWFNEGFASLFEQSTGYPDGRMRGLPNWRLPGLQESLAGGEAISLRELMSTTTAEFYGPRSGLHYAMARYLCYYLQEHDLLQAYYRAFRAGVDGDPTGVETLAAIVGEEVDVFDAQWQVWVSALAWK